MPGRGRRARTARSISGTTMCAYAPSSIRTSASSASSRAELTRACSRTPARWKLAQAAHPRVRRHARLSLGLHLDRGRSAPSTSTRLATPSRRVAAARWSTRPDAGCPARTDADELVGRPVPAELELLDRELLGVGRLTPLGLGLARRGSRGSVATSRSAPSGNEHRASRRPRSRRRRWRSWHARTRAGVEPGLESHDAHAGLGVAGEDRPLDRSRTPPSGQEREVHVHEPERDARRAAPAGGAGRRPRRRRPRRRSLRPRRSTSRDASRGAHREAELGRPPRFTGLGVGAAAPPPAAIGLRDDEGDVVAGVVQRSQRRHRRRPACRRRPGARAGRSGTDAGRCQRPRSVRRRVQLLRADRRGAPRGARRARAGRAAARRRGGRSRAGSCGRGGRRPRGRPRGRRGRGRAW